MVWEKRHAEDLKWSDTFLWGNETYPSASHVVSTPVTEHDDSRVKFCTHLRWSDRAEGPSIVKGSTEVYVLKCTCNGMSFICNRWVFTGQCSCVHQGRTE